MIRRDSILIATLGISIVGSALHPWQAKAAEEDHVRFGIITDLHYADIDSRGARVYRDSDEKTTEFVNVCNTQGVDFVIENGDFKDAGSGEAETLAFLGTIEAVLQGFNGPTYHVLGNHDMDAISKSQFLATVTNTGIDPAAKHYSFDMKGVHFVVLDANYKTDGTDYDHGNFDWKDANIPQDQLDWLSADLEAATTPAIIFCHQLLGGDGSASVDVNNAPAVRTVLENSGKVIAVFMGHHHSGNHIQVNGIHYYTLNGAITGEYPTNNAFAVVEIIPGEMITTDGYGNVADTDLLMPGYQPPNTIDLKPATWDDSNHARVFIGGGSDELWRNYDIGQASGKSTQQWQWLDVGTAWKNFIPDGHEVVAATLVFPGATNWSTPWSPHFRRLLRDSELRDVARGRGLSPTWYPTPLPLGIPIDHVLVSDEIGVAQREVGPDLGSDHRAVRVELSFRGAGIWAA